MPTAELDELLLNNWADLDAAAVRAQQIQDAVFKAVDRTVKTWADALGWSGVFDTPNLWFSAPAWTTKPGFRPSADAFVELSHVNADNDYWSLTDLLAVGNGSMVFRIRQTRLGKRDWSALITAPENSAKLPAFLLDDIPSFTLPIRLDIKAIMPALHERGDFSEALQPLNAALDKLAEADPIISSWLGPRSEAS